MLKHFRKVGSRTAQLIRNTIESIETAPFTPLSFFLTFSAIMIIRILIGYGIGQFPHPSFELFFFTFVHYLFEILFIFLLMLPVIRLSGAQKIGRAANLGIFAILIFLTPPIVDRFIIGSDPILSIYEFGSLKELMISFVSFFDETPWNGITYGTRAEIAVVTIGIILYSLFRKKGALSATFSGLLCYSVLFVMSTFPSWITLSLLSYEKGVLNVTANDAIGIFLTPDTSFSKSLQFINGNHSKMSLIYATLVIIAIGITVFRASKTTFLSLLKNIRIPQAIWHGGLLLLGGGLAMIYAEANPDFDFFEILSIILLIAAVESAWLASVVGNDIADHRIDAMTNPSRPIPTGDIPIRLYAEIGTLFFFASLLFSAIVSFKAMLLLLAYQGLAWIYSMPPLRLKRIPVIATVLAATAGMTILVIGFSVFAPGADIKSIPLPILTFLFIAYAVTLPLKDFKDIEGDKADGVFTLPVLLGAERARIVVGSALFLMYMASPVVLHESALIVPAILFGSLSFWNIVRSERIKKSWGTFRTLPGWNMLFITLYGIFVAIILL
jgi:4-hydroxybenzoate polyprenyltransferase